MTEYILEYQNFIEDKSNIFFRDNILLPWISVQTMRVKRVKCQDLLERPGIGEYYFDQLCQEELDQIIEEDIEDALYSSKNSLINTKFGQLPDKGNRKDVLIYDMKLG